MGDIRDSFVRYYQTDVLANLGRVTAGVVESIVLVLLVLYIGRRLQTSWRSGRLARTTSANIGILIGRLSYLAAIAVAVVLVANIFNVQITGILTFLGAFSLAVVFAVQDVLKNLVAGLYLLWEKPFLVGDAIKVKDVSGTVEDVQVRTTVLRAENGQLIVVPNSVLFTEIVINRRLERAEPEMAGTGTSV